jgi:hypothetical protein
MEKHIVLSKSLPFGERDFRCESDLGLRALKGYHILEVVGLAINLDALQQVLLL